MASDTVEINPYALRLVRTVRNLKQATVAVQAGISVSYYCELESGAKTHPSREVLAGIMDALGVAGLEGEKALTRWWLISDEPRAA
jgi:transcriptional regulator with XRE-family HTH domain